MVRQVLAEAPTDSGVRKLARCELKVLERMREGEANVATRDEVQILEMSRNVLQARSRDNKLKPHDKSSNNRIGCGDGDGTSTGMQVDCCLPRR